MTAFVRAYLVTILKALVLSSLIVAEYWFLELGFCAIICGMYVKVYVDQQALY